MPAVSKKQFKFMEAVSHGMKPRNGSDLTPGQAKEYVSHNKGSRSYSHLPEEHHEKKAAYEFGIAVALRTAGLK